ncbi:MAG: hypothetical protein IT210_22125 [Armatimonadetes bacterium]|nr:hypothetical protein [Armatimonadota bacterium]
MGQGSGYRCRSCGGCRVRPGSCRPEAPARSAPFPEYFATDLAREGWSVSTVSLKVYDGPDHQDGRTLLAIRDYLRQVKEAVPGLRGVVMVGSFPEAMLVRQYNWRQYTSMTANQGKPGEESFGGKAVFRIRSMPEMIAGRSDLILADLEGRWESVYRQGPEELPWAIVVYPDAVLPEGESPEGEWLKGGSTRYYETGTLRYSDFFFLNDGKYTLKHLEDGTIDFTPLDDQQNEECSPADSRRPNPMPCPDILVSRIDARHIALRPQAGVRGSSGEGLLDAGGRPQIVVFAREEETPRGLDIWEWDAALEKKLLIEYFDRNHRYRSGAFRQQFIPAAAAYELDSAMASLAESRQEWKGFGEAGYNLSGDAASLLGLVRWLKKPAVMRAVNAHSDPWGSHFKKTEDVKALEAECGAQPWSWLREGNRLVPTLGATGKLDFAILRTLWENRALPDGASFYLHFGCDITTPAGADSLPYNHPAYAHWQGGESLLFYGRGLSLIGRAKTFYDFPTDFARLMGEGKTFGDAWAHYFEVESTEKDIDKVGGGIGRKRACFWGILGDWTLRLAVPEDRK